VLREAFGGGVGPCGGGGGCGRWEARRGGAVWAVGARRGRARRRCGPAGVAGGMCGGGGVGAGARRGRAGAAAVGTGGRVAV
jgi:hypothetical protein